MFWMMLIVMKRKSIQYKFSQYFHLIYQDQIVPIMLPHVWKREMRMEKPGKNLNPKLTCI